MDNISKKSSSIYTMDITGLPSVNELKTLATSTTVPLSLRIKESTKALFDVEAQKTGCSINTLINTLLDTYAERYIKENISQQESKKQILQRCLETAAKKAGTLDLGTLLQETIDTYHPEALFENQIGDADQEDLIRDCIAWANGRPTRFFKYDAPYFYTVDGVVTATGLPETARIKTTLNELENLTTVDCYLRIDYWIELMAILQAYEAKFKELYPDRLAYLGEQTYRIIAQFANTISDRADFAQLVAQAILKSFEIQQPENATTKQKNQYKLTLAEILVIALKELGGSAHLSSIYRTTEQLIKQYRGDNIGAFYKNEKVFQSVVRGTLERCSKDCNPNTKQDYFSNPNKSEGYWYLNPGVYYDEQLKRVRIV